MKDAFHNHRELNLPAEMRWRAMFVATSVALAAGIPLFVVGLVSSEAVFSLLGLGLFGLAWGGGAWLQKHGGVDRHADPLDVMMRDAPSPSEARAAQLMTLLEQWEEMEARRGTRDFDPWALQALRNDIRRTVESDPGLEELFTRLRQAA